MVANNDNEACLPKIYVPNAFVPDGDDSNDLFYAVVSDLELFTYFKLSIYDRWGELIFSSTDMFEAWDGTINDNPVKADVFCWVVDYKMYVPTKNNRLTGRVTLVR